MSTILFVSYEIHPTTWGGAGVLLHHAATQLLSEGHRVVFLLDVPAPYFERFDGEHRLALPRPDACAAYHVDALAGELPFREEEVGNPFLWKSLRFDHALDRVLEREPVDFVEFFEYCGVGHAAFVSKRFGRRHRNTILGARVHNSVEWIDAHESTKALDRDRYLLYALERAALRASEAVLFPSRRYAEAYYLDRYGVPESSVVISQSPKQPFGTRPEARPRNEVVYLGRVFEFKGVETFVRAALIYCEREEAGEAAAAEPLRFVLIGSDSADAIGDARYGEYLLDSIPERYRDRFELTGHLEHEAVLERLGHALFGVLPNRFESFCYAAHELYDAGVPLVANDIPAFRNYFENEKNALIFDGSVDDLVTAMTRMARDEQLRQRLTRPYPIATEPLGSFYARPRAGTPLASDAPPSPPTVLALVVRAAGDGVEAERRSVAALRGGSVVPTRIVVAREVEPGGSASGCSRWLGRLFSFHDPEGAEIRRDELRSGDALWALAAGDQPDASCLELLRGALETNGDLGFAGTWSRDAAGRLQPSTLDIAPELHPFDAGSRLTRALIRTEPGRLLFDLFDPRAGSYGEAALLWTALARFGPGAVLAEDHLQCSATERPEERPEHLAFLVTTIAGEPLRERLTLLSASLGADRPPDALRAAPAVGPTSFEEAAAAADRYLNGRTLVRLALRKLAAKLRAVLGTRDTGSR